MSTFYVLPPRALGDRLADLLQGLLPGLDWGVAARQDLAELLLAAALAGADAYAVPRDELPPGAPLSEALRDGYGAEAGDEVVEVRPSAGPGEWWTRRWRVQPPLGAGRPVPTGERGA